MFKEVMSGCLVELLDEFHYWISIWNKEWSRNCYVKVNLGSLWIYMRSPVCGGLLAPHNDKVLLLALLYSGLRTLVLFVANQPEFTLV